MTDEKDLSDPPGQRSTGPAAEAKPAGKGGRAALGGPEIQAYIGRQLRAVFDDVARQPVPERFLDLMKQLENRTTEG